MSLDEYRRKRNFSQTPEPAPNDQQDPEPARRRFYIQRHDATRLHYDLRLEIDGVLKSWAVPKGPSLDPAEKRLAMHVEDHPIDYGTFEGNIPKGNYGAGSVMLWDYGAFEPVLTDKPMGEQLAKGELKFRLHGHKVNGEFTIVRTKRGKGNEWLLIKKRDEFVVPGWDTEAHARSVSTGRTQQEIAAGLPAAAAASPPSSTAPILPGAERRSMPLAVEPMMAHIAQPPKSSREFGPDWLFEIKWDGVRSLCYVKDGKVKLVSRNGNVMDHQYPELLALPHALKATQAIVDGEIVVLEPSGRSSFPLLQKRISAIDPARIAHLVRNTPVQLFLFDLLYLDGWDLRNSPLSERKKLLQSIVIPNQWVRVSEHFKTDVVKLIELAREQGLEGIVAKRASSTYQHSRSKDWLKIKLLSQQEFIICGYTLEKRDLFSSLALGLYEGDAIVFVGLVGTGFDQPTLEMLFEKMQPLVTEQCPYAVDPKIPKPTTWLKPELVCEVRFLMWTVEGRLRAPSYLGLRPDISPRECVREIAEKPKQLGAANEHAVSPAGAETKTAKARVPLIPANVKETTLTVEKRRLKFTNLDKVYFPKDGVRKRDVLNFYHDVAPFLLPHLAGRPLSLRRYPDGIEAESFFQKDTPESYPDWLSYKLIPSEGKGKTKEIRYIVGDNLATLLYLVNLGCIDHNPWMSRVGSLANPDFILIDLDPFDCPFSKVVEAAMLVRDKLEKLELTGYPKTTGGNGLHVYIPLEPRYTYDQARDFAQLIGAIIMEERPDLFTTPRAVEKRTKGRVYFDYLQIGEGKTIAAPYVVRPRPGATVATPLDWSEVRPGLTPAQFDIRNTMDRFLAKGDIFEGVLTKPQRLEPALRNLEKLLAPAAAKNRKI